MKCPNCSFFNTDDIKTCRVCGFELTPAPATSEETSSTVEPSKSSESNAANKTPVVSEPKISKRRMIDDSEDEALDSAFKSIFGADGNPEDDPLDVATVERFLQKKRHIETIEVEDDFSDTVDEPIDALVEEEEEPSLSKKKVVFMVILSAMLLILLALKIFWPGLPWKYVTHAKPPETTEVASTEIENTTETVLSLGEEASLTPVNDFFNLLPEFINRGNLGILSLFDNSQEALEVLTSFAVIGNLEKIADATLIESEATTDNAVYKVSTITNRLINGQQTQTASVWDFRAIYKNDIWVLESMAVETGEYVAGDTTESVTQETTETSTEVTTEKQTTETTAESTTQSKTEPTQTTEATTEANASTLLKGFKSSGSFSGGEKDSGQDVAFVRHGRHETFERLAFDFYEWIGGRPTQPEDVVTSYSAGISDDGRTISIIVNGAIEAYASQSTLNLSNSANIESVSYNYFGNGEAVAITIILKQPSQYKVFNLVSPAKLVVDIAPFE